MQNIVNTLLSKDFWGIFGVVIVLFAVLFAAMFIIAAYFVRLKKLERQIDDFKNDINARLERFESETKQDFAKERHMINESLSGMSETLMRTVMNMGKKN